MLSLDLALKFLVSKCLHESASSDLVTPVKEWSLKTNAQSRPICFSFQHLKKNNFNQSQQIYVYEQIEIVVGGDKTGKTKSQSQ